MTRSLFVKYISICLIIIFIGFIFLSTATITMIKNYAVEEKYKDIETAATEISIFARQYYMSNLKASSNMRMEEGISDEELFSSDNTDFAYDFNKTVELFSDNGVKYTIFVVNMDGYLVAFSSSYVKSANEYFTSDPDSIKFPDWLRTRLMEDGVVRETGDMDGNLLEDTMYVSVPVVVKGTGEMVGAVFVATMNYGVNDIISPMLKTVIMISLLILLAIMVSLYFVSERLVGPIQEMSLAAREFSKGKYDRVITVRGKDEVAQLAIAFNKMGEELKNLEYMRSSFVSSVSHELRTPMTCIGGFVDSILQGAVSPEEERKYLEIISSEIKRLSRLVTQLLEISRMEQGKTKMNRSDFDICEMARIILISNEQRLEEKRLDVEFDCDDEHMFINADHDYLHQVMYNICDNAIKFSGEGAAYKIGIHRRGSKVQIDIFNEGIGISKEDLPFVFDRFYKSDKSRGIDKTGVGLGMYIVKCIINQHGEEIRCDSEYGKWAKFSFTMPYIERKI